MPGTKTKNVFFVDGPFLEPFIKHFGLTYVPLNTADTVPNFQYLNHLAQTKRDQSIRSLVYNATEKKRTVTIYQNFLKVYPIAFDPFKTPYIENMETLLQELEH